MSGVIGHLMYAMLGAKAAESRGVAIDDIVKPHWPSYLAGSYLGSDIQTMPEAICVDTGQEVGYGTVPLQASPLTGGMVRPWYFEYAGQRYRPKQIHEMFYGRSHLVFGWNRSDQQHVVPWDHLADYCALLVEDTIQLFGPGERPLAYVFGWMVHVVSDSLIKSIRPAITLDLLDGKYTPKNRPIQDLVTFHEIGRKELGIRWEALLADMAETPVEPVQLHGMRVSQPRGQLSRDFPNGWVPEQSEMLQAVLKENRRYLKVHVATVLKELELLLVDNRWECSPELQKASGGLTYQQMITIANEANFRHALWQMGEAVADLFQAVFQRVEVLRSRPRHTSPDWNELTNRWRARNKP